MFYINVMGDEYERRRLNPKLWPSSVMTVRAWDLDASSHPALLLMNSDQLTRRTQLASAERMHDWQLVDL